MLEMINNANVPPHNQESEQAIIGTILQNGKSEQKVREALDLINVEMFYLHANREIFQVCVELPEVDFGLVIGELSKRAKSQNVVFDVAPIVAYKRAYTSLQMLNAHCKKVAEAYTQRQLATIAYEISEQALSKRKPIEIIDYINRQLSDIDLPSSYQPKHIKECLKSHIGVLEERSKNKSKSVGIQTGIDALDKQIVGIGKTWLVVLAGRPSHGKSLIAQMIGSNVSRIAPTMFFSMEMEESEIMDRLFCLEAGIDEANIRQGIFTDAEFGKMQQLSSDVSNGRFNQYIDTTPNLALNQIKIRAKKFKQVCPDAALIQIDYLGLIKTAKSERHDLAIAELTRELKGLAKEIQVPIMLLVQLNRDADKAKRITMSNLADSSAIERDPDLVLFTRREEVEEPTPENKGFIQIICGKFRHGSFNKDVFLKKSQETNLYTSFEEDRTEKTSKNNRGLEIE